MRKENAKMVRWNSVQYSHRLSNYRRESILFQGLQSRIPAFVSNPEISGLQWPNPESPELKNCLITLVGRDSVWQWYQLKRLFGTVSVLPRANGSVVGLGSIGNIDRALLYFFSSFCISFERRAVYRNIGEQLLGRRHRSIAVKTMSYLHFVQTTTIQSTQMAMNQSSQLHSLASHKKLLNAINSETALFDSSGKRGAFYRHVHTLFS